MTGRGTGVDDPTLGRKVEVVASALLERPVTGDPVETLASLGGFEHAGIAGFVLGAAALRVPVILDGVIAGAAALVAQALAPGRPSGTASPATAASSPATPSPWSSSGCARWWTSTCGWARAPGRCCRFPIVASAGALLREMATFDSAGVARKDAGEEPA